MSLAVEHSLKRAGLARRFWEPSPYWAPPAWLSELTHNAQGKT